MSEISRTFKIGVSGGLACFTRPEFKTERVSYEAITPSAARGILEAVLWKPAIFWVVSKIHVLNPIRFISFRRNEVKTRVPLNKVKPAMKGKALDHFFAGAGSDACAQRNTVALRDVAYIVEAHYVPTPKWGPDDSFGKFDEMFQRRLEKGQTYHQPYLGCREFAAEVGPVSGEVHYRLPEEQRNKHLGWMLHDLDFRPPIRPKFFSAAIKDGIIDVPPFDESFYISREK